MGPMHHPTISAEELLQLIRSKVEHQKAALSIKRNPAIDDNLHAFPFSGAEGSDELDFIKEMPDLPKWSASFSPSDKIGPHCLKELLQYRDTDFVTTAYIAILHRLPDPGGHQHFLDLLRSGCHKVDILGRLRYSPEGRKVGAKLPGLGLSFFFSNCIAFHLSAACF